MLCFTPVSVDCQEASALLWDACHRPPAPLPPPPPSAAPPSCPAWPTPPPWSPPSRSPPRRSPPSRRPSWTPRPPSRRTTQRPPPPPRASPPGPPPRAGPPPRCSPPPPGWPATRGCAPRSASGSTPATRCWSRWRPRVEQFAGIFTQMGGLMAERVTDLRDIERRVTARIVGEPEPGVPGAGPALRAAGRGPRARRHRRPRRGARGRAGHRAGRPDQPHRDHRPPARHPLRGRRRRPAGGARPAPR